MRGPTIPPNTWDIQQSRSKHGPTFIQKYDLQVLQEHLNTYGMRPKSAPAEDGRTGVGSLLLIVLRMDP